MESPTITLELPVPLYTNLQALARQERLNLPELLTRLLQTASQGTAATPQPDAVCALMGVHRSAPPLMDDIPASAAPDLYLTATATELRSGKHAWESAPVIQALLSTGRVRHLTVPTPEADLSMPRQTPPTLAGAPVSEVLVAQRRGEL